MLYLVVIVVLLAAFLIFVQTRPSDFRIVRSAQMAATPEAIFPHVNTLRSWEAWSPWLSRDPECKKTYEGPPSGVGSVFTWDGNKNIGSGRMTITESRPSQLVRIRLEFIRPFPGTNAVELTCTPDAQGTMVMWAMTGKYIFVSKAMGLFMNMDAMIGRDFEKGLANIKAIVENTRSA